MAHQGHALSDRSLQLLQYTLASVLDSYSSNPLTTNPPVPPHTAPAPDAP
jgi:hypothetical protein